MTDYSRIDIPDLLQYIFYPRADVTTPRADAFDFSVNVEPGIDVACRFYQGKPSWPSILFFHGNGEVASDYDDMAPLYLEREINLIVADYRGYGRSGGVPTLTDIASDCHPILSRCHEIVEEKGFSRKLVIMGRSLGSVSALELASAHPALIKGVIIESGFVCILSIVFNLGLPLGGSFDGLEGIEAQCEGIARNVNVPALIIHGEEDSLVPVKEGKRLHQILGSMDKKLVLIEDADHNTIAFVDVDRYFDEIQEFVQKVSRS
jgi:uncharacterized protein